MVYEIIDEPDFIRIVLEERIEIGDLIQLSRELQAIEDRHPTSPDRLVEVKGVLGPSVDFEGVMELADVRRAQVHEHRNPTRLALVADTPVVLGVARMYQMLSEHPLVTTRICSTVDEAEAWLRTPRDEDEEGGDEGDEA